MTPGRATGRDEQSTGEDGVDARMATGGRSEEGDRAQKGVSPLACDRVLDRARCCRIEKHHLQGLVPVSKLHTPPGTNMEVEEPPVCIYRGKWSFTPRRSSAPLALRTLSPPLCRSMSLLAPLQTVVIYTPWN